MYLEAIESGRLPGDILDDIPCKYVNGALLCEVSNLSVSVPSRRYLILGIFALCHRLILLARWLSSTDL